MKQLLTCVNSIRLLLCTIILASCVQQKDNLIFVEGGTYMMGDEFGAGTKDNGNNDERPVHEVTVKSFWIGKYEITQEEWEDVMNVNPSMFPGEANPVEKISWYDCVAYCNLRSGQEGLTPC